MDNISFQPNGEGQMKCFASETTDSEEVKSAAVQGSSQNRQGQEECIDGVVQEEGQNIQEHEGRCNKELNRGEDQLTTDGTNAAGTPFNGVKKETKSENPGDEVDRLLVIEANDDYSWDQSISSLRDFDSKFTHIDPPHSNVRQIVGRKLSKCSGTCIKKTLLSVFPFINILRSYSIRQDLAGDIIAGFSIWIMHIPLGMASALIATLTPVYGLYTSFFPVFVYFFFGTSKHISIGPAVIPCMMIGTAVTKGIDRLTANGLVLFPEGNLDLHTNRAGNQSNTTTTISAADDTSDMSPEELNLRLQFAMSVTFIVGIIQLMMSLFRLGFITDYMSDVLISGFTTAVACHISTSQLQNIFGVKLPRHRGVFKLFYVYRDFFLNIETVNYFTVIIAGVSMIILYCTSRFINQNPKLKLKMCIPVPIEFIVVVLGTVFSFVFKFEETFDVDVVSDLPKGLPVPDTKCFSRLSWVIVQEAIPIVIYTFTYSASIAKVMAKKNNYEVDANQELLAFGVSTVVSSFFSSLAPMAAITRTVVQERVGGKTQIAGLVSCGLLLVVLSASGQIFKTTPKCVLAAVVIVSLRVFFSQIFDLKNIYTVSKINFAVWIMSFLSTLILDIDLGIIVALAINLFVVICRIQRPNAGLLGRMPHTKLYSDIAVYQEAKELPGIKIFRYEQSLFFLNKEHFRQLLSKHTVSPSTLAQRTSKIQKVIEKNVSFGTVSSDAEQGISEDNTKENKLERQEGDLHTIIIDCSHWSFIDTMGVNCLKSVIFEYENAGVNVLLANCRDGVHEMFKKTRFYDTFEQSNVYVSLHDAVLAALRYQSHTYSKQDKDDCIRVTCDENEAVSGAV